jgi:hypothetical protein
MPSGRRGCSDFMASGASLPRLKNLIRHISAKPAAPAELAALVSKDNSEPPGSNKEMEQGAPALIASQGPFRGETLFALKLNEL